MRENRTEALDACRQHLRDGEIVLPRAGEVVREFASHVAADVKQLVENEETGAKAFRYVRTGTDHFSLALAYDCVAWSRESRGTGRCIVHTMDVEFFDGGIATMDF